MKRIGLVLVAVLAVIAAGATPALADDCSSNNGYVACKYLESATLGPYALVAGNATGYWETSTMWRPASYCSEVGYYNSAGYHGLEYCGSSSSFSYYGPFGYSVGYCANDTGYYTYPVTCEVFNYYT